MCYIFILIYFTIGFICVRNMHLCYYSPKGNYRSLREGFNFGDLVDYIIIFLVPLYFIIVATTRRSGWNWRDYGNNIYPPSDYDTSIRKII